MDISNCCNSSAQNCKKCPFMQFKGHNLTYLLFPLQPFVTFISESKNTKCVFSRVLSFGSFWSVKYLNFSSKTTDSDSSSYFYRHPEVTKNLYYVLSTHRGEIPNVLGSRSCTILLAKFACANLVAKLSDVNLLVS